MKAKKESHGKKLSDEEKLLILIFGKNAPVKALGTAEAQAGPKFEELKQKLGEVLRTMTEREQKVLELRFGLGDGYSKTLDEIGQQFRVTRERIRQIEAKALRKMRHPTRVRELHGFLETKGEASGPQEKT